LPRRRLERRLEACFNSGEGLSVYDEDIWVGSRRFMTLKGKEIVLGVVARQFISARCQPTNDVVRGPTKTSKKGVDELNEPYRWISSGQMLLRPSKRKELGAFEVKLGHRVRP
jgi:hypothetical protein